MNFNVSSMKDKASQNKVNTCMKSIKNIIYDYVPFSGKDKLYDFFEYSGNVNEDTKILLKGKRPSYSVDVMGNYGPYLVHCGRIDTDGYFYGRNLVSSGFSSKTETVTTKWNYPGTNEYTYEVKVGTTDFSKITIPGYNPMIIGDKFYTQKEVLYTSEVADEVVFKASATDGTKTETVQVTAGECNEYAEKICLAVIYEIAIGKMTDFTLLKLGGFKDPNDENKVTFGVFIDEETDKKTVKVYKSPVVDKLFKADEIDIDKTGKSPEVHEYKHTVEETTDENNKKTIITTTIQPQLVITKVTKVENEEKWLTEEHFEEVKTTKTETTSSDLLDAVVNIGMYYE